MAQTNVAMRWFHSIAGGLVPILKSSAFVEKGVLTPDEFVAAGDLLVAKCPTWRWAAGEPSTRQSFLPADKQFLVTKGGACLRGGRLGAARSARDGGGLPPGRSEIPAERAAALPPPSPTAFTAPCSSTCAVPSHQRVSALVGQYRAESEVKLDGAADEDGWLSTHTGAIVEEGQAVLLADGPGGLLGHVREDYSPCAPAAEAGVAAVPAPAAVVAAPAAEATGSGGDSSGEGEDDEYADMMAFSGVDLIVDPATAAVASASSSSSSSSSASSASSASSSSSASASASASSVPTMVSLDGAALGPSMLLRTRTYDVCVCYDRYYQTPRIYLFGFNEDHEPLSPDAMMEDVMQDYANRTVTVERHPNLPSSPLHASIHPCRHAEAMRRIIETLLAGGASRDEVEARVDTYLFIFLKFIQSVVPTIDYDFTTDVDTGGARGGAAGGGGGSGGGGAAGGR